MALGSVFIGLRPFEIHPSEGVRAEACGGSSYMYKHIYTYIYKRERERVVFEFQDLILTGIGFRR